MIAIEASIALEPRRIWLEEAALWEPSGALSRAVELGTADDMCRIVRQRHLPAGGPMSTGGVQRVAAMLPSDPDFRILHQVRNDAEGVNPPTSPTPSGYDERTVSVTDADC